MPNVDEKKLSLPKTGGKASGKSAKKKSAAMVSVTQEKGPDGLTITRLIENFLLSYGDEEKEQLKEKDLEIFNKTLRSKVELFSKLKKTDSYDDFERLADEKQNQIFGANDGFGYPLTSMASATSLLAAILFNEKHQARPTDELEEILSFFEQERDKQELNILEVDLHAIKAKLSPENVLKALKRLERVASYKGIKKEEIEKIREEIVKAFGNYSGRIILDTYGGPEGESKPSYLLARNKLVRFYKDHEIKSIYHRALQEEYEKELIKKLFSEYEEVKKRLYAKRVSLRSLTSQLANLKEVLLAVKEVLQHKGQWSAAMVITPEEAKAILETRPANRKGSEYTIYLRYKIATNPSIGDDALKIFLGVGDMTAAHLTPLQLGLVLSKDKNFLSRRRYEEELINKFRFNAEDKEKAAGELSRLIRNNSLTSGDQARLTKDLISFFKGRQKSGDMNVVFNSHLHLYSLGENKEGQQDVIDDLARLKGDKDYSWKYLVWVLAHVEKSGALMKMSVDDIVQINKAFQGTDQGLKYLAAYIIFRHSQFNPTEEPAAVSSDEDDASAFSIFYSGAELKRFSKIDKEPLKLSLESGDGRKAQIIMTGQGEEHFSYRVVVKAKVSYPNNSSQEDVFLEKTLTNHFKRHYYRRDRSNTEDVEKPNEVDLRAIGIPFKVSLSLVRGVDVESKTTQLLFPKTNILPDHEEANPIYQSTPKQDSAPKAMTPMVIEADKVEIFSGIGDKDVQFFWTLEGRKIRIVVSPDKVRAYDFRSGTFMEEDSFESYEKSASLNNLSLKGLTLSFYRHKNFLLVSSFTGQPVHLESDTPADLRTPILESARKILATEPTGDAQAEIVYWRNQVELKGFVAVKERYLRGKPEDLTPEQLGIALSGHGDHFENRNQYENQLVKIFRDGFNKNREQLSDLEERAAMELSQLMREDKLETVTGRDLESLKNYLTYYFEEHITDNAPHSIWMNQGTFNLTGKNEPVLSKLTPLTVLPGMKKLQGDKKTLRQYRLQYILSAPIVHMRERSLMYQSKVSQWPMHIWDKNFVLGVLLEEAQSEGEKYLAAAILVQDAQINRAMVLPGGIDLNTKNMGMTIQKDANGGVKVNFDPALIERIRTEGVQSVDPVIIRITAIADVRPLLGI